MVNGFNIDPNAIYDSLNSFGNKVFKKMDSVGNKMSTKYGAGNQYKIDPNAKTVSQIKQGRQINQAIKTGRAIDKGINALKTTGKIGAEFGAPIVGGTWDMYSGYQKIKDGNPLWGAGQMLYGAGELGLDLVGLLGSAFTGGGAEAADIAMSAAARKTMQTVYRNLIKQGVSKNTARIMAMNSVKGEIAKNAVRRTVNTTGNMMRGANRTLNSLPMNIGSTVFFEGGNALSNMFEGNNGESNGGGKKPIDVTKEDGSGSSGSASTGGNNGGYGGGYGGNVNLGSVGSTGLTQDQLTDVLNRISQGGYGNGGYGYDNDAMAMAQEYMYNQQMMEPYRRNLQNYIRDYNNRADLAYNQDKELALLSSLTGASGLNSMIGKNNSLVNEANRLGLMKTSGEDLKSVGEGMQTLLGNIALARQTGLPLRAANADTKMAQLAVNKMIADDKNENRLQVAQYNGALKLQIAQEKARLQMYLRSGNRRAANDSYKRLRAMTQAAGLVDKGVPIETINAYTGLNIPANMQQSSGEVKLER